MKFCQRHWDMMRAEVEKRGMTSLVSEGGQSVIEKMVDEVETRRQTLDNFDPLMAMHWNIAGNILDKLGESAGYLLLGGDAAEDPIDITQIKQVRFQKKYQGKTWPRCPVCYINIAHEISCTEKRCMLQRENGYDVAIGWSADAVRKQLDELMNPL